ncbi:molybdopterin-guanine dinucleotide biosynthesis protein MobB [Actinopolymorpha alba]|uniref:molybdopterin-guanine dinucleotide biosynthesis protein MobB n=1 Tax=Actinopolymorpha alba TaxID=533267 RepID=UPI000367A448|nr:molybdopterin-guanine dinucleotide biosynthesis protein MobB [Actinopolymorpha alba]
MPTSAHQVMALDPVRLARAKRGFTTRNVHLLDTPHDWPWSLVDGVRPQPGDLVLARVTGIGQHAWLERPDGRRATMYVDDEVVVAYGARYAPDAFEGLVSDDLGPCDLLAGGGIAGQCLSRSPKVAAPTRLEPSGLLAVNGQPLNLRQFARCAVDSPEPTTRPLHTVGVVGTSMNAGKTTALAALVRGLSRAGLRVGAVKVTGTGSGGDLWKYEDAGAEWIYDFTDAGYPTTYKVPVNDLERAAAGLVDQIARRGADVAVVEIADGIFQAETAALLASPVIRLLLDGVLFAAGDALGAQAGADRLRSWGYDVRAVTGRFTASPLALREAEACGLGPLTQLDLQSPRVAAELLGLVSSVSRAAAV